jgi:hypothetical protein
MWNENNDQWPGTFTRGVPLTEEGVQLTDWGVDGGHLLCDNDAVLALHGSHELVAYLVLTGSLDEVRRYLCLASS